MMLSYYTFTLFAVFIFVLQNSLFASIRIAIYAEMPTGVIHANIFANHTATNLPLPLVL